MPHMTSALARVRELCLALPETYEMLSHGEPTFRVGKKQFAMFASAATHHGSGRDSVWVKSTHMVQATLVQANPDRCFLPPYVAHLGWLGLWLDAVADWDEVADLLHDGYCLVAPKRLLR